MKLFGINMGVAIAIVMTHWRGWVTHAITYGLIQCGLQQIYSLFGLLNSGGDELSHVIRKDWARQNDGYSWPMSHGLMTHRIMSHMSGWYRVKKNATVLIEEIYSKIATCKGDYDVIMTSLYLITWRHHQNESRDSSLWLYGEDFADNLSSIIPDSKM